MIYNRGLKEDYEWGVPGWDGATAEAFFTVSEKCLSNSVEEVRIWPGRVIVPRSH